ncbi:lipocalin-like domain-containing protein [Trichocoleus sp. FACHB-591]|uniref:lipocalin-like domain-containing protein n=1 Tax=Trichocoleus sp. FACHB-591 TaxID=2692872 RepID=UPI001682744D|nr:lipocalin-like domain-containing protein [Trichocoleus sp. FACHB-591]MBD2097360.1 lipocalin-like domain-containing protein [Trichocoleus sp. FACHB-591]
MTNQIVGTWRLLSCETRTSDGRVFQPLGANPVGELVYTDNGFMSVAIMKSDRLRFQAGDIAGATPEEKIAAADSFISYCGSYKLEDHKVVHHVNVSFFPNWVGTNQVRFVELAGDRLTLSTPPMVVYGIEQVGYLIWERVATFSPQSEAPVYATATT